MQYKYKRSNCYRPISKQINLKKKASCIFNIENILQTFTLRIFCPFIPMIHFNDFSPCSEIFLKLTQNFYETRSQKSFHSYFCS